MYFETAGIHVSPWIPPLVAFVISFFTSMGGVSGAFLLLPFQMSVLGYTTPSVSATNQLFNVVAIPSGVYRYIREGRMVWPLTAVVVAGTLPGVLLGAIVRVKYLPDPTNFRLFAAAVLLYIGVRMLRDLTRNKTTSTAESAELRFHESVKKRHDPTPDNQRGSATRVVSFNASHIEYEFHGGRYRVSTAWIFVLCMLVGIVGGIYGIGGGAIVAPLFVAFFHLPIYTIAGAALMGTFVTSVVGVAFYQAISGWWPSMSIVPDWKLGVLFGIGGAAGMYLGARCQKFVPSKLIKWMLAGIIVVTAGSYVWAFVATVVG
ncbi:MAG: hypothetical protein A2289_21915 [Deltaproteobacteria bacterium RIFOXYA12_FULL_58_15]|nr:MAG: hypothetical protein A2289_21915 [Deltaproteobacteria bacterium RIFOXYA12_FULL_58_15]OGR09137.1 MAG: hypothetical protein A2341_10805 [Deltaproteobacteria bacterium RIFOXYB12_FULL_58_9]